MVRVGQRLGKYRIRKRLASGGFARVFRATDTFEGVDVALKVPLDEHVTAQMLEEFKREVRVAAKLRHPNVLMLKNADQIDDTPFIAYPLGEESLEDRLRRRITVATALDLGEQLLAALAYAHELGVIHCDVKPANLILFEDGRMRLADFGIAKVAASTVFGSASGTLGYMAPEQALGRPSARSDVFSAGLVLFRIFGGRVPQWPFDWPPEGFERVERLAPDLLPILRKAMQIDTRRRYRDCQQMLEAYRRARRKTTRRSSRSASYANGTKSVPTAKKADWRTVRLRQLKRQLGGSLQLKHGCGQCGQPVDEHMRHCPWCGEDPKIAIEATDYPATCPRCDHGVKLDWKYCASCYGAKIGPISDKRFTDRRYDAACSKCRGRLIPHSKYCPWCRARVRKRWRLGSEATPCTKCGNDVMSRFWHHCPWCGTGLPEQERAN